jgi:EmrB/QacA subfamily drug resistance transporter
MGLFNRRSQPAEAVTDDGAAMKTTGPAESIHSKTSRLTTPEHSNGAPLASRTTLLLDDEVIYPTKGRTAVILACLYTSMFLVALDRTILATAIPRITDDFQSIDDIGWYISSYLLTACAFILLYGKVYTYYSTKWTFLSGIALFEVGSAICGAAPTSIALIVGRAIQGFGSSGIFTGAITIMIQTIPLHKRPLFQGLFGATFAIASVVGPLLGGAFTDSSATWRWCFYINLPLGGVVMIALIFFLKLENEVKKTASLKEQFMQLDPIGTLFFLPSIVCLLLALQWGGTAHAWNSWRIILLLTAFAATFVAFVVIQYFLRHTTATVPARIIFQRSILFGSLQTFFNGACFMTQVYYIPIWFQAIKGSSPLESGIQSIPLIGGLVVLAMICGAGIQKFGYYTPLMWAGGVIMSIAAGLIYTWTPQTQSPEWIGYQVLFGIGVGFGMQAANLAAQTVLKHEDVPVGTAIIFFAQSLGAAVFASVGQNIFLSKFASQLHLFPEGVLNIDILLRVGATEIRDVVPPEFQAQVIESYNYALMQGPMLVCIITACLTFVGSLGVELRSTKEQHIEQEKRRSQMIDLQNDVEKAAAIEALKSNNATMTTLETKPEDSNIALDRKEVSKESLVEKSDGISPA